MNTMPRASTCCPSGTWVASTSIPARKAGNRMPHSICPMVLVLYCRKQAADGVVEKAKEIFCTIGAAHGEGQQHRGYMHFVGNEFRRPVVFISRTDHHLHRILLQRVHDLREIAGRWGHTGLWLQGSHPLQSQPILHVNPTQMLNGDG